MRVPHTERVCMEYLNRETIEVMNWPARSPDKPNRTCVGHSLQTYFTGRSSTNDYSRTHKHP